ncbi:MAG: glycosyltransferase family 4 protein, partial [Elusimicrobia bacterium]|nr:glycosyltransferase family 4 protein [Elusimicrobiota bacterium]
GLRDLWSARQAAQESRIELLNAHTGSSHTLSLALAHSLADRPRIVRTRADARPARRTPAGRVLWRRTAGFIAPTNVILAQFKKLYPGISCPAATVYPGIEGTEAAPEPDGPPRVGIIGRLDPVKGHADFLRAAALVAMQFPQARFLIAGREENVRRAQLEALLSNVGLRGRCELLGHVPDALAFIRSCHVGVVASTGSEAVSRAAIEWMSAGRPVVATAVGCLPEFIESGLSGILVPPSDAREMAAAISALLGGAELRRRIGERARRRFESQFSFPRFIRETERFYEQTLHDIPSR